MCRWMDDDDGGVLFISRKEQAGDWILIGLCDEIKSFSPPTYGWWLSSTTNASHQLFLIQP